MTDPGAMLKAACDAAMVNPKLQPEKVKGKVVRTHCNEAAIAIAGAMGCQELAYRNADEQYQIMNSNATRRWKKVTGQEATIHALGGGLAFAALPSQRLGEAHGHIAAVYPVGMQASESLKKDVPLVANVGGTNGLVRVSKAFPVAKGEPDYFVWEA